MNNVLLWIGGLLVALLCALFAIPHFVDWTRYRGVFEEEASRVLGRELRVAGAVNLRLLPTPYVRFEKVRLSDHAGQTGEPFFRADDFTLWLAPGPLLRGAIEAREVELRRPTLKLRLNAQGGGNWQTLSISRGALPFVPSDVALQSVMITDGTVSIDGAEGNELLRLSAISGELSVAALEGPFRFKGGLDWSGDRHEVRLATTAMESDGAMRLKSQVGVASSGSTYTFDGRLSDLSGRVKLEGQVAGQLAVLPTEFSRAPSDQAKEAGGGKKIAVELRSTVAIDAQAGNLADISISFEQDGKPQLLSGAAQLGWKDKFVANSEFAARWIDLDGILAGKAGGKPLETMRRLTPLLSHLVPASGHGRSRVSVDQVTLGGESLGDVRLDVERDDAALKLVDFKVSLPGATRASMSGTLAANDAFDGEVSLRGANLLRLTTWLGYAAAVPDSRTDGAFSLKSKFAFDKQSVSIRDASAGLGNAMLTGGVGYRWVGRPRLDVVLDGDQIDLGLVSPHALNLMSHVRRLTGNDETTVAAPRGGKSRAASANSAVAVPALAFDPMSQDVTLRIRAGRLIDADRDLRDVDVDAAVINGRLGLRRMHFLSGTGLELEAEGDIADIGTRQRGALRGTLVAADESALAELVELFDQPEDGAVFKRLRPLAPARVAWTAKFGDGKDAAGATAAPAPVDIWLDGALLGRRLTASVRFENGVRGWRQGQMLLNAAIERPDWPRLRRLAAMDMATTATPAASGARGRLLVKLTGRPDQALNAFVKLDDDAFDAGLSGRLTLGAEAIASAEGELQLRTSDAASALTTLGLQLRNLPGVAIEGTANVAFDGEAWKFTPSALEVAGATVGGELSIARKKDSDRHRVEGRLTASRASILRLLDLLVDAPVRDAQPEVWQSGAFDFSLLDRIEGRLRLDISEFVLGADLALAKGSVDVAFARGKIDITDLGGEVMGGRLSSRWTLEKAPAGGIMSGSVKVTGAQLGTLPPATATGARRLGGTAALTANVAGRGLTPRGLISAMTGKGEIEITGGDVGGLSPQLVRRLSEEVVTAKREATAEVVGQGVMAMLSSLAPEARLALGDRRIGFDVADGAVKLKAYTVDTADGRASNRTTLDLASLMIDSEWKIEQRNDRMAGAGGKASGPLPPVTIVFVGPAAALGRLAPTVSVDALVRELVVRRMEHDVEELERLRKLDEERAKAEAERKKAAEAARAAAIAAAAAAAVVSPWMPGVTAPVQAAPDLASAPVQATPANPQEAAAVTTAPGTTEGANAPAAKRRGVATEPRQVPSSQQLKNQQVQEVFKRRDFGGN